jgi:hypothetical protein
VRASVRQRDDAGVILEQRRDAGVVVLEELRHELRVERQIEDVSIKSRGACSIDDCTTADEKIKHV